MNIQSYYKGLRDILVVEDDPAVREMIVYSLSKIKQVRRVLFAENGVDAMLKIRNQKFLMIVVDLNMPKMDGLTLVKQLCIEKIPLDHVMIVSGEISKDTLASLLKSGIKNIFSKPLNLKDFQIKVLNNLSPYLSLLKEEEVKEAS